MSENNPLRIYTIDEISDLSKDTLQKYKKEKLLRFQLTDKYTIKLNGFDVDKNTIVKIFSELEHTLDENLLINSISELRSFLNSSSLFSFNAVLKFNFSDFSSLEYKFVMASIKNHIDTLLGNDIAKGNLTPFQIKHIVEFGKKNFQGFEISSFPKSYQILHSHLEKIELSFLEPFVSYHHSRKSFKPEIFNILDGQFYDCLNVLPRDMNLLVIRFARACNGLIDNEIYSHYFRPNIFTKPTLLTIKRVLYIVLNHFTVKRHEKNIYSITKYLENSEERRKRIILKTFVYAIIVILFLLLK